MDVLKSIRPVPRLVPGSTLDDVRQAVMSAHKLHIKWSVRLDAAPARLYALVPRLAAEDGRFVGLRSWTLVLNDGVHVMHSDRNNRVKLRRLDTGEIVWEYHLKSEALCVSSTHSMTKMPFSCSMFLTASMWDLLRPLQQLPYFQIPIPATNGDLAVRTAR